MAEVVQQGAQQASTNSNPFQDISSVFTWIGHYWWVIVIILVILVGLIAVIYIIWWLDREQKRKDPMYVYFERTIDACNINKRKDFIKKKRRWWMLLLGVPTSIIFGLSYLYLFLGESWLLFWTWIVFGFLLWLPFAILLYAEKSMRVINVDNRTVGHYRGHCKRMDGYIYVLLKIGKKWVFLDEMLCVRMPENVLTIKRVKKKDRATKEIETHLEWDKIEIDAYVWNERDNYIFVPMTTLVKEDSYFYFPTLVENGKIVDLRQKVEGSYHLMTQIQMAEQTYSQMGKVTNNAVDSNVGVVAEKKKPEKQRDVNSGDGGK